MGGEERKRTIFFGKKIRQDKKSKVKSGNVLIGLNEKKLF